MKHYLQYFFILRDLGINYKAGEKSFVGVVYNSEDLQEATDILYQLGFTYYTEGSYSEGVLIETTGVVEDVL